VQKIAGKHVVSGFQDSCYRAALDSAKAQKFESLLAYVTDHGAQRPRRESPK
jgi:L-amino acid N-acyltransferase YncA